MIKKETITLPIINFARHHFRNTWVHRIPLTSWIYHRLFEFTYKSEPEKQIIFRGYKYIVPTKDTAVVPSMISGDYENYELELYKKLLNKNDIVLDIGANIGVYSIEASNRIGDEGKVYAFEPIQENLKLLKRNLKLNFVNNTNPITSAIGKEEGVIKIYKAKNSIATHTAGAISDEFEEVNVESIDSFCTKNDLKINLIKMDIEGYEGFALEGGLKTLEKQQPILFIEFSSHHLKQCGYSPLKHAKNLLKTYKYCYLIDEKNQNYNIITSATKLSTLYNGNIILSSSPITI